MKNNRKPVYSDAQENEVLKRRLTQKAAQFNELKDCYQQLQHKYAQVK